MSKRVLITGGAGYIGTHTVIELYNAGYEFVIVDNYSNSSPSVIGRLEKILNKKITAFNIDLKDKNKLREVFEKHNFEGVIHFAGLKAVGESSQIPLEYYKNNIMTTINLCELMAEFQVKNLVFSSSATVYGVNNEMPVSEEGYLEASNPYGRTKLFIEEILRDLYQSDPSWKITLLRYFNPIGAHNSGLIGESPSGIPNNLMPFITNVATGKLDKLKVFGNDYDTKDGTGVRDYIHVTDLAKGHVVALKENSQAGVKTYNMGTGNGYSVLEVIKAFKTVTNKGLPYEIVERRVGDIGTCYADVTKTNTVLGWSAKKDIYEMCEDAWRWQIKNPEGYKK